MEQNRNGDSRSGRDWREDWDGQDSSIPEPPWVPDEIDILLHPELAQYRPVPSPDPVAAHPEAPATPNRSRDEAASRRTAAPPEPPLHVPALSDSGFYYRNGKPIPPTHPDHGPMHLLPRQEDGSFAAYYYCSHEELAAMGDGDGRLPAPPPRRRRRDGFDAERQQQFVEHYRDTGSLTDAARLTGISRSTAYNLLNSPDGGAFRDAIAEAGRGIDTILESTAFERCINGQEEIVYYQGRRVGVRWRYDNKLLMQMLRARQPLRYAPLSEIEGWLKRRGLEPPPDVDGALDRLAAAEAEWGRRLPGEGPPADGTLAAPATPLPFRERDGAAQPQQGEGTPPDTPAIASSSSSSSTSAEAAEDPAIASSSSTLPAGLASAGPAEPAHAPMPDPASGLIVYRPPPKPRLRSG
ncbi:MAG TPA: helix-turn-helix domain-containing protein [Allosphingosinicella sp.]